ncbi:ABC transporter [Paenibacillus yonginensis]|uniref:ABC transporter n=1 Tax=Paenibacillus yonginensis TaxID=1462996 RepID=A0A1B1N272_9BACL|nr:ABC transporter ATP-binding protein [Paenibacillus yonginensis]ANS75537.1 ABC transporter [Paenibacillus yonginensis]
MPSSAVNALPGDNSKPKPEKKGSLEAFKAVFAYAKPHKLAFSGVFVCALLGISADLLQPYLVKIAIDDHLAIGKKDFDLIGIIAAVYLGISIISFIFTYLQNNLLQYAGQSIVAKIRNDLFGHISKLSMSYFDKVHRGSLVTNVSSDTETISQFFTQVLLSLIRDGMTLVLIIVFMFQLDATLAWYCLIALPVIGIVAFLFRRYLREAYQTTRSRLSRLIGFIAENLSGMGLIQAFRQEEEQTRRFTEHNQSYWEGNMREVRANVLFNRTFDFLGNAALVLVVWLGGMAVFHKQIEVGVLYAFTSYIRQFFAPINQITMQWNTFQSTMVSMDRIWSIFSTRPAVKEPAAEEAVHLPLEQVQGRVDFNHISFGYTSSQTVIPDLDLHIAAGEMIGVVGTTGAGKSTLISLLNRFYDVTRGSIEIDGIDIRRLPQSRIHRIVGLIQQEPYLFSGSILDNVRLFQKDISREKVVEACQFVGAHDMIMRMPGGYETPLTERGSGLSAGERQLISFARIVVFKPKILILDEATANLDSQTEQLVQDALQSVSKGRTTIVIAHRLSTVMHADRIIVMKHGRAVEQGTHDQLLARHGYYAELYRHAKQASGQ